MKFRFALLIAALTLLLTVPVLANDSPTGTETPSFSIQVGPTDTDGAASSDTETGAAEDDAPFVLLRVYEGQFTDVTEACSTAAESTPSRPAAA